MPVRPMRTHTFLLILGQWNAGIYMGMNPEGKKIGILGMGGIGKAIAQRVRGFEMEILYHNRSRLPEEGKIIVWWFTTLA
jgi:lactate dehydrogenase-like 2-hydroxyacid dehydrogenase